MGGGFLRRRPDAHSGDGGSSMSARQAGYGLVGCGYGIASVPGAGRVCVIAFVLTALLLTAGPADLEKAARRNLESKFEKAKMPVPASDDSLSAAARALAKAAIGAKAVDVAIFLA